MRRTEVPRGWRRVKFEGVYGRWQESRLSPSEAVEIVGLSERACRYEDDGVAGRSTGGLARR